MPEQGIEHPDLRIEVAVEGGARRLSLPPGTLVRTFGQVGAEILGERVLFRPR
ncbi:MAG: hypothetical protein QME77_09910 [bacterium]|nr:hypothetical protein [bacterium]